MNETRLFREEALHQGDRKETRGELPVVYGQKYHWAFWFLGICVFLMCVWGMFGWVNETVYGGGVITHSGGYGCVVSPGQGILMSLDVDRGDEVVMGQIIGRIFSNDDFEEYLLLNRILQYQESVFKTIEERCLRMKNEKQLFSEEETRRLSNCIERVQKQNDWYRSFLDEKVPKLASSGVMTPLQVAELYDADNIRLREREELDARKMSEKVSFANSVFELENSLLEYELKVNQARFNMEQKMRSINYRSRIISYCNGKVANINVSIGEMVHPGTEILRVSSVDQEVQVWTVRAYFPVSDARKIRPGMQVAVTPSVVKAERDGSILGVVASVSETLETRESLNYTYHNESFADLIFTNCGSTPILVEKSEW